MPTHRWCAEPCRFVCMLNSRSPCSICHGDSTASDRSYRGRRLASLSEFNAAFTMIMAPAAEQATTYEALRQHVQAPASRKSISKPGPATRTLRDGRKQPDSLSSARACLDSPPPRIEAERNLSANTALRRKQLRADPESLSFFR